MNEVEKGREIANSKQLQSDYEVLSSRYELAKRRGDDEGLGRIALCFSPRTLKGVIAYITALEAVAEAAREYLDDGGGEGYYSDSEDKLRHALSTLYPTTAPEEDRVEWES